MPKERSIPGRIINQMMYERCWYDDVEEDLYDETNFDYQPPLPGESEANDLINEQLEGIV